MPNVYGCRTTPQSVWALLRELTYAGAETCLIRDSSRPGVCVVLADMLPAVPELSAAESLAIGAEELALLIAAHESPEHSINLNMSGGWPASAGVEVVKSQVRRLEVTHEDHADGRQGADRETEQTVEDAGEEGDS